MLYLLSFIVLAIAESLGILRDFCVIHNKRFLSAMLNGTNTALWCVKIIVLMDNPLTVITSFLGSATGVYIAFYLNGKINKTHDIKVG